MGEYHGNQVAPGDARFAVLVSRFNEFVTKRLLEGCTDELARLGVSDEAVDVVWSPGSFEIPVLARRLAESGEYAAVICLGAVIRGGTEHHRYVAAEATKGVAQTALNTGVPCLLGVLTCDTIEQAVERAGAKSGNKGADAARSAVEMVNLLRQLPGGKT
jgi:6,7-dimethyl-8-ribityllumazine synthase